MTPRPDVEWVDVSTSPAELREALVGHGRRYLLVCEGDLEHIAGVAYVDDLLRLCLAAQGAELRGALSVPVYVPAAMPVLRLLEVLREAGQQVAVALDEYGGLLGVVTLDDILEGIVGPLPSADEAPALAAVGSGTWVAAGSALAADVEELLDVSPLDPNGGRGFRTVGGFFMSRVGREPAEGYVVVHDGHRFTVEAMEGRRVARVRIERVDEPDADALS